jgi:Concanavalin A-like lectin/glucanases superfamily
MAPGLRRLIALVVLLPACLLLAALPASAATKTVLHYTGALSGTTVPDESGSHSNGTAHDITASGGAYSFNGISSYIQTPASSAINPGWSPFSYSVTIYLPTTTTFSRDYSLVRRGSSKISGAYYKMEMVYDKSTGHMHLTCALRDAAGAHATVSTNVDTLKDGQWHTLTCSKTARTISLTKDGDEHTKRAKLGNLSSTEPLNFGADEVAPATFVEHFPGLMHEMVLTQR